MTGRLAVHEGILVLLLVSGGGKSMTNTPSRQTPSIIYNRCRWLKAEFQVSQQHEACDLGAAPQPPSTHTAESLILVKRYGGGFNGPVWKGRDPVL